MNRSIMLEGAINWLMLMPDPIETTKDPVMEDEAMLVAYLADRDVQCPVCKYNLRGLTHPQCPECGSGLRLTVGSVDGYLAAWTTMIAPLCAAGSIGFFAVYLSLTEGWPSFRFARWWETASFFAVIASTPASIIAILLRRKFQRLQRTTQWVIAWSVVALAFLLLIEALYEIR
jgi:hypothetical protein